MNERLNITPLGPIGALVENVELARPLGDGQFEQLYHALLKHQVLFFRNQPITPLQQRDLAGRFGDLHIHPVYPHATDVEEIIVLDTHNDNPPDNDNWHTDVTFIENPPLAAKTLPSTGGDTLWASGIAAYEALSAPFRTLLAGLRAEHDFTKSFPEHKHRGSEEEHQRWQLAVQKTRRCCIRWCAPTRSAAGRRCSSMKASPRGSSTWRRKSDALLNFLFAHITKPEFQVRWRWQENDVAIWDNRVTQHYANADYLPQRRIMHRATILGIGLLQGLRLRLRKPALTVPAVPVHPAGHFRLFQRGFGLALLCRQSVNSALRLMSYSAESANCSSTAASSAPSFPSAVPAWRSACAAVGSAYGTPLRGVFDPCALARCCRRSFSGASCWLSGAAGRQATAGSRRDRPRKARPAVVHRYRSSVVERSR